MAATSIAVLINIIEARDLKPRSSAGMCDPVLVVEVLGEKDHTPIIKKDLSPFWNHYFHLESKTADFERETLVVSVFDTATMFRRELIGTFDFELNDIYGQKNHEYYNQWVILTNHELPGKKGVQGYLKLSVTVLKPGDTPAQHSEEEADDTDGQDENLSSMVLLKPKGLDATEHVLKTRLYRAENLPKMDAFGGTCDPFVEVQFATDKSVSSTVKNTMSPTWNEEVQLPVTLPSMADIITVRLLDYDAGAKPDFISQKYFSFKEWQAKPSAKPIWANFYRGEGQGKENIEYSGRVLLNFATGPGGAEGKTANVPVSAESEPEVTNYTLQLDVFECQGVDAPLYPIYVVASIGPYAAKSSMQKIKNKTANFYESVNDLDFSMPSDLTQVPDLFIYVYEDVPGADKRHGYLRYNVSQLGAIQGASRWEILKSKKGSTKDDEHPAGFIHFRVNFGPSATIKQKPRTKITAPTKKPYQVRAHLYAARDLPAGDEDALSDPYCLVNISNAKGRTKTKEHTIYPDWFETVTLEVELPDQRELSPDIHLNIYDYDTVSADDFLGRVVIPITDASTTKDLKEPKWYPLSLQTNVKGKGEILASFQIIPLESAKNLPLPDLHPKLIDTQLSIGVIGLREIVPFQLVSVANTYIKFTVPGAKPVTTKKSNNPSPSSPNFFENITIPVALPESLDFVPALLIEVFDPRAIGKDAKVAAATVPLASFVPWAAQANKLPFGVHLPPAVDESAFYQSPAGLPSPKLGLANPQASTGEAVIDIPEITEENEATTLLPKDKGKSSVSRRVSTRPPGQELSNLNRREVPSTVVPGMEEEPEEPQRTEVVSELEHQMRSFPFLEVELLRGVSQGVSAGPFTKKEAIVGKFKGSISVKSLAGGSSSKKTDTSVDVTKLAVARPYVLRVYIEQGQNLVPHDANGSSDPYIVVFSSSNTKGKNSNNNIIRDRENAKPHTLQPDFYKMYELKGVLPDDSELKVQVWDRDEIGSDEFIGETRYDLEMLWFSEEWRKLALKPKENRTLWNPLSSFPQGKLKMWVELLTLSEAGHIAPSPIGPPVRLPFELRIIVWETRNVVPKDKILGKDSSDQFIRTKLLAHAKGDQQTDVHDSVMDGCGKFNWRILYPDVLLPYDTPRLKLQVYDKDRVGPNDAIAEANLNLKGFFQKALRQKTARIGALGNEMPGVSALGTKVGGDNKSSAGPYNTGQWLDLYHPSFEGPQGSVCLELELLTREDAAAKRAGPGREEPNQHPFLPAPVRPSRKWFSDLFQFLGLDKIKKYLIIAGIVIVAIIVLSLIIKFA